jgi:hypothetical protein
LLALSYDECQQGIVLSAFFIKYGILLNPILKGCYKQPLIVLFIILSISSVFIELIPFLSFQALVGSDKLSLIAVFRHFHVEKTSKKIFY